MNIRPLYDRIVVKRMEEQETTHKGIIIPDSAREKPQEGEVIAVGRGLADRGDGAPKVVREFRVNRSDISIGERGIERSEEARVGVQIARVLRVEYARDPVPAEAGAFVPENSELGLVVGTANAVSQGTESLDFI